MDRISNALGRAINYLSTIGITDFLDIIIVAYLIYKAIWFVRKANSHNLAKGLILILLSLWLSEIFDLKMISYILRKTVELGMIALLILFQPELRRMLEKMGSSFNPGRGGSGTYLANSIDQAVQACDYMSLKKIGALMVFERNDSFSSIIDTGTVLNADVTAELLKNLFFNKAPLHDGAVIIRDGRIEAAGCVLPLTARTNLSKELGMRHRAGIGMSEQSDAVVVIVSEETGAISVAIDGTLKRHLDAHTLSEVLTRELISTDQNSERQGLVFYMKKLFKVTEDEKNDENNL